MLNSHIEYVHYCNVCFRFANAHTEATAQGDSMMVQENVLEEATLMIPDTRQRLEGALQDLTNFVVRSCMLNMKGIMVEATGPAKSLHISMHPLCNYEIVMTVLHQRWEAGKV